MIPDQDCEHEKWDSQKGAGEENPCPDCGTTFIKCQECSKVSGSDMPVYHTNPTCNMAEKVMRMKKKFRGQAKPVRWSDVAYTYGGYKGFTYPAGFLDLQLKLRKRIEEISEEIRKSKVGMVPLGHSMMTAGTQKAAEADPPLQKGSLRVNRVAVEINNGVFILGRK